MSPPQPFKVLIVGGSIAGLTLAHSLHRLGIDFLVLEAHDEIAPQVGASIGIFPNGARVLDQLGVFDDVEAEIEPVKIGFNSLGDQAELLFKTDFPKLFMKRFGYPLAFLDRQLVLEFLYRRLPDDAKKRVILKKRVVTVDSTASGVSVTTKDGSVYYGSVVAGADGVHSTIRREMWRHAGSAIPKSEYSAMFAEYCCIFGISTATPGLSPGEADFVFNDHFSYLLVTGKEGRIYWFLFKKLDRRYTVPNIPRFSAADCKKLATEMGPSQVRPGVPFSSLWENRVSATMAALEENVYSHWQWGGRFVILGDSAHKLTPNLGQGGNSAIESAAVLANVLAQLPSADTGLVESALKRYEEKRRHRIKQIFEMAGWLTRIQARDGTINRLFGQYVAPNGGDVPANLQSEIMVGAEKLSFLPEPKRTQDVWMPFDSSLPPKPSPWARLRGAWPFLLLLLLATGSGGGRVSWPINILWLIEHSRRGNQLSPTSFVPIFIILASIFGPVVVHPLFYTLHHIFLPTTHQFLSQDQRSVPTNYLFTLLPTVALAAVWSPWWILAHHWIFSFCWKERAATERLKDPMADGWGLVAVYVVSGLWAVIDADCGDMVVRAAAGAWVVGEMWEVGVKGWGWGAAALATAVGGTQCGCVVGWGMRELELRRTRKPGV